MIHFDSYMVILYVLKCGLKRNIMVQLIKKASKLPYFSQVVKKKDTQHTFSADTMSFCKIPPNNVFPQRKTEFSFDKHVPMHYQWFSPAHGDKTFSTHERQCWLSVT